ncbi:MAG: AhpC/TSA family protein [Saprospiraceae bacterium]|nr:AhpC/TSA family protein [Saprospiraceae bacterium]
MVNRQTLSLFKTNKGNNLSDLSDQSPVLIVFLRHFGCVFCKESMYDISRKRGKLYAEGIKVVLVHMSDYTTAEGYFKKFDLTDIEHISDPDCKCYSSFGLLKGSFSQLFGLKTWIRGFEIATTKQMLPDNKRIGDGLQMPGIFLVRNGNVVESFIHHSVADKPDYQTFINVCHLTD